MKFSDIALPEAYLESADFRFFINWFASCLSKIKYDTDNIVDLLDPERCPKSLLWLLADTQGFKYDDRLLPAYNRLVLKYFMSMIYNRGSSEGMILAAEVNLVQFNIQSYADEDETYADRLKDSSIPVNSVYVNSHVDEGYIELVYYSENDPVDACTEYVRPLGMYTFNIPGVNFNARTKLVVDARLTSACNEGISAGATRVNHYTRADYASLQTTHPELGKRRATYFRNLDYEGKHSPMLDAGYRSLYSLQISNNEHIVKSLLPSAYDPDEGEQKIFDIGYGPQDIELVYPPKYLKKLDELQWNLLIDADLERKISRDVYTIDTDRTKSPAKVEPAVNTVMTVMGESISCTDVNTTYTALREDETLGLEYKWKDEPN